MPVSAKTHQDQYYQMLLRYPGELTGMCSKSVLWHGFSSSFHSQASPEARLKQGQILTVHFIQNCPQFNSCSTVYSLAQLWDIRFLDQNYHNVLDLTILKHHCLLLKTEDLINIRSLTLIHEFNHKDYQNSMHEVFWITYMLPGN